MYPKDKVPHRLKKVLANSQQCNLFQLLTSREWAISNGANVIMTRSSPLARTEEAEKLLGTALSNAFRSNLVDRSELFLISRLSRQDVTPTSDSLSETQLGSFIEKSLYNLMLDSLDGLLIDESCWKSDLIPLLEKEVSRGRIANYGISFSDSLGESEPLKEGVREGLHFGLVDFPLNIVEGTTLLPPNSLSAQSKAANLFRFSSRPLTTFEANGKILQLKETPSHEEPLNQAIHLEKEYRAKRTEEMPPLPSLSWGHILSQNSEQLQNLHEWMWLLQQTILPQITSALLELQSTPMKEWAKNYRNVITSLFSSYTKVLEAQTSHQIRSLEKVWINHLSLQIITQTLPSLPSRSIVDTALGLVLASQGSETVGVGVTSLPQSQSLLLDFSPFSSISPSDAQKVFAAIQESQKEKEKQSG